MGSDTLSPQTALLDLSGLDALLRQHDMPRGPDDWLAVHDLLLLYLQQGRLPSLPSNPSDEALRLWCRAMANLLGPLLCRSPEEQMRFPHLIAEWLTGQETLSTSAQISVKGIRPWVAWLQKLRDFDRRQRIGLLAALVLLAGLSAMVVYWPPPVVTPPVKLPEEIATQPASLPVGRPPAVAIEDWAPPNLLPEPVIPLPAEWQQMREWTGWAVWLWPWLLALPWLVLRYARRQKILETDTPDGDEVVKYLDFANPAQPLYGGGKSEQALNHLGKPVYGSSRRLHVADTVEATARQGGYLVPCYQQALGHPVYLILVHSQHISDHQALLAEELVRRFHEAGLRTDSYRFPDSPSQLIPWPLGRDGASTLSELAGLHDFARLIVISEGRILFHPATGQPRPWLDEFEDWPQRAWLGVGDLDALDGLLLEQKGFLCLPLETLSLDKLAAYLANAEPWQKPAPPVIDNAAVLPGSIADYPSRWLKPYPPREIPLPRLLAELRDYLKEDGWLLLQTLLAFPRCQWNLTQAVDYQCFKGKDEGQAEPRERRLTRLMKLPWLTHAYFPPYLREQVLRRAGASERQRIGAVWNRLLKHGENGVEVLTPSVENLVEDLKRAGRAWALGDPVFLQILRGKPLDFWHFRLPQMLDRLFPTGRNRWDLRHALAVAVLAALLSTGGGQGWERLGKDWLVAQWQARIAQENSRWPVVIGHQDGHTQALAEALREKLSSQGFRVSAIKQGKDYTRDELGYPKGGLEAARCLAYLLRHISYGLDVRLVEIPGAEIHLDLAHSYQARAVFNDSLVYPSVVKEGETFQDDLKDGGKGPAMVVIPPGSFMMGSPDSEKDRSSDEGPQHHVTIPRPFALGRTEVTFDDYDRYAKAAGKKLPDDKGWGRGDRPVIEVSWQDAQDYAAWLSRQTGKAYRLPSEAEWEYAARAGTQTSRYWGDDPEQGCAFANGADAEAAKINQGWTTTRCSDGYANTAPVASFKPNAFGLYDMSGNVWEWVQDCWHDNYQGAPGDGTAWDEGTKCASDRRGVRGGSWLIDPQNLHSAFRLRDGPYAAYINLGFRLARAL